MIVGVALFSLYQQFGPVDDYGDRRVCAVGDMLVEQEALAVGGHIIFANYRVCGTGIELQSRLEKWLRSAGTEESSPDSAGRAIIVPSDAT